MTERNYIIHTKNGNIVISEHDAIENALQQEKEGIAPSYQWYDYKKKEAVTNPGWLVWSTWSDGCGVAYRRHDGKMILITGWQSDFSFA